MADDALAAIYAHMDAINSRDVDRVRATHNYPFLHLWPDGGTNLDPSPDAEPEIGVDVNALGAEWHHSTIDAAEEIIRGGDVVSYRVKFSRHRADDSILGRYEAIWIVTREQGHWGIKFRNGAFPLDR